MAPRTTYANLADGLQPFTLWDASLADMGNLGTIPCTASGTNAIVLTPIASAQAPTVTIPNQYQAFSFVPAATSTGTVTVQIGTASALKLYRADGTTQIGANDLSSGVLYEIRYNSALNSSAGGYQVSSPMAGVVQSVVNDTNVTGSITGTTLTLGWTGTLAAGRLNSNVVQAVTNDTNIQGSISAQNLTFTWNGVLALSRGGTNNSLTASAGGIAWSDATKLNVLSGTATANQLLVSGSSATPAWSTNTWPVTSAQGDLLYGSAANVISSLAKNTTATRYLANTGTSNAPNWDQVNLANGVTGNLSVNNLNSGSSASAATFWRGDGTWATPAGAGTVTSSGSPVVGQMSRFTSATDITGVVFTVTPQGRITLTSATPVLTTTVSGATTVYYTPYVGQLVPIFDGTTMIPTVFTELSQATTDATKSPAAVAASKVYDLFVWNDSGTLRCTRGPAWTNSTTRGYTLTMQNGILLNTSAITNGPGASRGTWVGTIASNGSSTIDYIFGASASGGTAAVLNVWNTYNRVLTATTVTDSGTTYTYATNTVRQARASAGNQISFVTGAQEDGVKIDYGAGLTTAAAGAAASGVGLNSTTTFGFQPFAVQCATALSFAGASAGVWFAPIGTNIISANETSLTGTNTFDDNSYGSRNTLSAIIRN